MSTFDSIFGQEQAIDMIRRAYLAERLPHGLIFAGPAGVGKATTARALAALFLCESPNADTPCRRCTGCTAFAGGNHPDFRIITRDLIRYHDKSGKSKAIDLSINVIRPELVEPAGLKPALGRGKVFIIEQADLMNTQAQNSMLKTIEEPAGRTLIILLTDQPTSLLPTIRSRCQLVRFAALDSRLVESELLKRGIDLATASEAANLSEGSLGIALKWIEDGVIPAARDLIGQMRGVLSGRMPDDLPGWFRTQADAYADKQMERDPQGSRDQAVRQGLGLYLRITAQTFRQTLSATEDADELERLCACIDAIARAEAYLDANVNVSLVLQQLAVTLNRAA